MPSRGTSHACTGGRRHYILSGDWNIVHTRHPI